MTKSKLITEDSKQTVFSVADKPIHKIQKSGFKLYQRDKDNGSQIDKITDFQKDIQSKDEEYILICPHLLNCLIEEVIKGQENLLSNLQFDRDNSTESQKECLQKRIIKQWTESEDITLTKNYEKYNGKWIKIARNMPGRNISQCAQRWRRLYPTLSQRKLWTDSEDYKILEQLRKYGKNWKIIAQNLPGKSGKQVRDRYINHLDPNINKSNWSQTIQEVRQKMVLNFNQSIGKIREYDKKQILQSYTKGIFRSEESLPNHLYELDKLIGLNNWYSTTKNLGIDIFYLFKNLCSHDLFKKIIQLNKLILIQRKN